MLWADGNYGALDRAGMFGVTVVEIRYNAR